MRNIVCVVVATATAACLPFLASSAALAKVRITVDLDAQTMHVESKDHVYDWKISSGADGYETPPGTYGVLWMDKDHKSDEYNQTPMPNAIFFRPGFAIHGAFRSNWGHPASHGCIRLPVAKSAVLFGLVKDEGAEVTITGGDGAPATVEASGQQRRDPAAGYDDGFYGRDNAEAPGYARPAQAPGYLGYPAQQAAGYPTQGYGYGYAQPPRPAPPRNGGLFDSIY